MATSTKMSKHVIIPLLEKCAACSQESKLKYPIINRSGERCSSYEIASNFYEASFDCLENRGSYLCKRCYRLLSRILDYREKIDKLSNSVFAKSQSLKSATHVKRVIKLTPNVNEKKRHNPVTSTFSTPSEKQTQDSIKEKTSRMILFQDQTCNDKLPIDFTSEELPEVTYCDKTTQTDKVINARKKNYIYHQNSRHDYLVYKSVNTKFDLSKTVKYLSNGSVRLGVKSLLEHKKRKIQQQCLLAVQDAAKRECTELAKKTSTLKMNVKDIHNFDIDNVAQDFENNTKVLWAVLCAAASNKEGVTDTAKVCTAAAIIFNSRSVKLNALQHAVGISLYNNQLQKDGFLILSKLGITPSYVTVNGALNKIKDHVEYQLEQWKSNKECVTFHDGRPVSDHSYAAVSGNDIGSNDLPDHDYCIVPSNSLANNTDH